MCGIVGAVSVKDKDIVSDLLTGLKRLEYRGYDSAGIAVISKSGAIDTRKAKGKILCLEEKLKAEPIKSNIGIAHTRWATHGEPSEVNAHPQTSDVVAVVHNGIIENYAALKAELADKYVFKSQTDTEVITAVITVNLKNGMSPKTAVSSALKRLKGAFAIEVLFANHSDFIICARKGAPLAIGHGKGEMFIGSDSLALSPFTNQITYLEDGDWAVVTKDKAEIYDASDKLVKRKITTSSADKNSVNKGFFDHYMQKEIFEQPKVIKDTFANFKKAIKGIPSDLKSVSRISIIACGTSYHAGLIAKYWLEDFARVPTDVDFASEFRYRSPVIADNTLAILISQSGETADTLAALRYFKEQKVKTLAIVNVTESTIAREADFMINTIAGPEIAVASTKAFTSQLILLAALTLRIARERGIISAPKADDIEQKITTLPNVMQDFLSTSGYIKQIAKDKILNAQSALFIGRGTSYPIALEGALKLKEISYIHAEGYAAGEMKHGPIALVDNGLPIVVIAPFDKYFEKTLSNMQETMARGGEVIFISNAEGVKTKAVKDFAKAVITMPDIDDFLSPILYALPLQLLAYNTSLLRGFDMDQPRNLAKSVTVE